MWINRVFHWGLFALAIVWLAGLFFVQSARREANTVSSETRSEQEQALPETLNVLLVGIDKRYGATKQHCDAIHMLHIDTVGETIEIVNVPRGTRVAFQPPKDWVPEPELLELARAQLAEEVKSEEQIENPEVNPDAPIDEPQEEAATYDERRTNNDLFADPVYARVWHIEQYVANVCKYYDFETFVPYIERITGLKADYTVRLGFSETQALLRVLKFDPSTTLQFLRHRKTLPLGDVQRSYNQAIFIKDILSTRSDLALRVPKSARGALFHLLQTDMPYDLGDALLVWLSESAINGDASRVANRTAPAWGRLEEMHVSEETVAVALDERLEHLTRLQPGFAAQDVQPQVHQVVTASMGRAYRALQDGDAQTALDALSPVQTSHLWLQMEDARDRQRVMVVLSVLDVWAHLERGDGALVASAFAEDIHGILLSESDAELYAAEVGELLEKVDALFKRTAI